MVSIEARNNPSGVSAVALPGDISIPAPSERQMRLPRTTGRKLRILVLGLALSTLALLHASALGFYAMNAQVPYFAPPTSNLKTLSLEELGNVEITTQSKEPTEV